MKYLNGECYAKVKDYRYEFHPTETIIVRFRNPSNSLRTQYQVQNNIQLRKKQKVVEGIGKIEVKNYPKKKQPTEQQPKFKPPNCPSYKRNNWLQFDRGFFCKNCENVLNQQKHQIDKKVLRQDHYFSTRLTHANKKIREIY